MNFKEFYINSNRRLVDAITGMWATDSKESREQLKALFEDETLLAEPVFQSMFPWEPADKTFLDNGVFDTEFVNALDRIKDPDFRFPKDRAPYKHQLESWKTLIEDKKSIVVTSGTGSGKTECFMLPVLHDINKLKQEDTSNGVRAIFLYPLNALIGSQKKRMKEWTSALSNVNFAIYNGLTQESVNNRIQSEHYPEIISRTGIRTETPEILFTNPTMLEYMLVRQKDNTILKNSQGKLRWILLDEAHTLNGSTAAEMALLIRRVIDAFGVSIEDIRFAATSATVGDGKDEELVDFISNLTGQSKDKISLIKGKRVLTEIEKPTKKIKSLDDLDSENLDDLEEIHEMRSNSINTPVQSSQEITSFIKGKPTIEERLEVLDKVVNKQDSNTNPLLPLRGHFFVRGISGIYTCTNINCTEKPNGQAGFLNRITTIESTHCNCGFPMLEVVACNNCGEHLITGEKHDVEGVEHFQMKRKIDRKTDLFEIETDEIDEVEEEVEEETIDEFYAVNRSSKRIINPDYNVSISEFGFTNKSQIDDDGNDFVYYTREKSADDHFHPCCPSCLEFIKNPRSLNISNTFLNRLLATTVLEQVPNHETITQTSIWQGKRFISFTDSRQGTAKLSAQINNDSERNWIRSFVFNSLAQKRKELSTEATELTKEELKTVETLQGSINDSFPEVVKNAIFKNIEEIESKSKSIITKPKDARISWSEMLDKLSENPESKLIFNKIKNSSLNEDMLLAYLKSLLIDQFSRRPKRANNLENLGLVRLVYPTIENATCPQEAVNMGVDDEDWKGFLKLCLDYFIRENYHFTYDESIRYLLLRKYFKSEIFPFDTEVENTKKWPKYREGKAVQNRLVLILCAGFGWHSSDEMDTTRIDIVNTLLDKAWRQLITKILTRNQQTSGYSLSFNEKVSFELIEKSWICPITRGLLDCQFKGYSPRIKGRLEESNIENYKLDINKEVVVPYYPFPFSINDNGEYDKESTLGWIDQSLKSLKSYGYWTDLHERIFINNPIYLAGEHSAQQSSKQLERLEASFENGELNILSCSTTMEMGVDIGGISAVVMNNVPPKPANYLQRAGRAGRRKESKAIALTFCSNNPIGNMVIHNPKWAMTTEIASPRMNLKSTNIVQRHVNALFFGSFIRERGGLIIKETIENFLNGNEKSSAISIDFINWLVNLEITQVEKGLNHLVQGTIFEGQPNAYLKNNVFHSMESIVKKLNGTISDYEKKIDELKVKFGMDDSLAVRSVQFKLGQFKRKNTLTTLVEYGFLPSAGIPTGIVDFDLTNVSDISRKEKQSDKEDNPSFNIVRALKEYAPGASIIRNGWYYKSEGIQLNSAYVESSLFNIQACRSCGYQHMLENEELSNECPECGSNDFSGIDMNQGTGLYTKGVEPAGFSVNLFSQPERSVPLSNVSYTIDALLLNMPLWEEDNVNFYETRDNIEGAEILFVNKGLGDGFALCLNCGASKPETENEDSPLEGHIRLRGGKDKNDERECGNDNLQRNMILGGRFLTDFCEIKIKNEESNVVGDKSLLTSLAVIMKIEFCKILGIEENEIGYGFKDYRNYSTIFIYDTAKGGAGYSNQFSIYLPQILRYSLASLEGCDCLKSCTKCLINRESQWYLDSLDREVAIKWLKAVLSYGNLPEEISEVYPEALPLIGSLSSELSRNTTYGDVKELHFYINNNIDEWNIINWKFKLIAAVKGINVKLVVFEEIPYGEDQERIDNLLTLYKIGDWADIVIDKNDYDGLFPICRIVYSELSKLLFSNSSSNQFDETWSTDCDVFYVEQQVVSSFESVDLPIIKIESNPDGTGLYELNLNTYLGRISKVGEAILNDITDEVDLSKFLDSKTVKIEYSDRNLRSPLGCLILIELIGELQKRYNLTLERIVVKIMEFDNDRKGWYLTHNFLNNEQLEEFFNSMVDSYVDFKDVDFPEVRFSHVSYANKQNTRHSRHLEIRTDDVTIDIRPDAGLEYGFRDKRGQRYSLDDDYESLRNLNLETYGRNILYYLTIES